MFFSFIDYYKRQYDINILDPDQPMLISFPKKQQTSKF
jgi:hypothetical protein